MILCVSDTIERLKDLCLFFYFWTCSHFCTTWRHVHFCTSLHLATILEQKQTIILFPTLASSERNWQITCEIFSEQTKQCPGKRLQSNMGRQHHQKSSFRRTTVRPYIIAHNHDCCLSQSRLLFTAITTVI